MLLYFRYRKVLALDSSVSMSVTVRSSLNAGGVTLSLAIICSKLYNRKKENKIITTYFVHSSAEPLDLASERERLSDCYIVTS